ncbi:MAG: trypsin-like peptidase domain-containing protein [Acidimicrobiales bacterium]
MDWNDEDVPREDVTPGVPDEPAKRPISVNRHGFSMTYLSALAVLVLVVAIAGVGFVMGHYVDKPSTPLASNPSYARTNLPSNGSSGNFGFTIPNYNEPSTSPATTTTDKAAAKVAAEVDPGLVDINTGISYQDATAAGTGMILSSNGIVLTNNHVIEAATSITVRDIATGKTYKAKVVGYDVAKDVAVLKMEDASGLKTVTLGNSSDVTVNEQIVGIGNAGGTGGTPSYVPGTVVAKDQSIQADSEENPSGSENLSGLIETNAPIQPGDSGGPLVTLSGKVVGMDTAANSNEGGYEFGQSATTAEQAYSIPINTAIALAKAIENGDATAAIHVGPTAILGIEVNPSEAGVPNSTVSGVTVASVMANTPAASSGLAAGDVITSFDGHTVTTAAQLSALEYSLKPGASATIVYVDPSGDQETVTFALTTGPAQ